MQDRFSPGAGVTCTDGDLGDLLDVVTNEWGDVTHLVVRSWDRAAAVTVPLEVVEETAPGHVRLSISREEAGRLPSRPLTSTEALHGGDGARQG
ncbi:MAG TPA: hypothetical protein VIO14_06170 [Dehalococcoidia bacterium]